MATKVSNSDFDTMFRRLHIIGFFVSSVLAVIFHFLYEWTSENIIMAFFSPVNESVWEHIKILVFPLLIWGIVEYIILKPNFKKFFTSYAISIIAQPIMLVLYHYIITGIFGKSFLVVDIIMTFVFIFVGYVISYKLYTNCRILDNLFTITLFMFILVMIMIISFTVNPPRIDIFRDSETGQYGIVKIVEDTILPI